MAHFVYILLSSHFKKTYVGRSEDPNGRLRSHNSGKVRSTKSFLPWKRIHLRECRTKAEALALEKWFKTPTGRREIRRILATLDEGFAVPT